MDTETVTAPAASPERDTILRTIIREVVNERLDNLNGRVRAIVEEELQKLAGLAMAAPQEATPPDRWLEVPAPRLVKAPAEKPKRNHNKKRAASVSRVVAPKTKRVHSRKTMAPPSASRREAVREPAEVETLGDSLTITDAAKEAGVTPNAIYSAIRSERLATEQVDASGRGVRGGKLLVIPRRSFQSWVDTRAS